MSNLSLQHRSGCPIACGLDILGDKWTLLIIRDLLLFQRNEFGQFADADEGISSNILSDRLAQLVQRGLINKTPHPEHGKKFIYSLTDKGLSLAPVLVELSIWAHENIEGVGLPKDWYRYVPNNKEELLTRLKAGEQLV
jgi:DNA-binding HxlR family transcriptional regulator